MAPSIWIFSAYKIINFAWIGNTRLISTFWMNEFKLQNQWQREGGQGGAFSPLIFFLPPPPSSFSFPNLPSIERDIFIILIRYK